MKSTGMKAAVVACDNVIAPVAMNAIVAIQSIAWTPIIAVIHERCFMGSRNARTMPYANPNALAENIANIQ